MKAGWRAAIEPADEIGEIADSSARKARCLVSMVALLYESMPMPGSVTIFIIIKFNIFCDP